MSIFISLINLAKKLKRYYLIFFSTILCSSIFASSTDLSKTNKEETVVLLGDCVLGDSFWENRFHNNYLADKLKDSYSVSSYLMHPFNLKSILDQHKLEKWQSDQIQNNFKDENGNLYAPLTLFEKQHSTTSKVTVVIGVSLNEFENIFYAKENQKDKLASIKEVGEKYKKIIEKIKKVNQNAKIIFVVPVFPMVMSYFLGKSVNIEDSLESYEMLFNTISKVAEENSCQLLDLSTTFNPYEKEEYSGYATINPQGSRMIGSFIKKMINDQKWKENKSYIYTAQDNQVKVSLNDITRRTAYRKRLEDHLQNNVPLDPAPIDQDSTPFTKACADNQQEKVKKMVDCNPPLNNEEKKKGLKVAIQCNHADLVKYLLDSGGINFKALDFYELMHRAKDMNVVTILLNDFFDRPWIEEDYQTFLKHLTKSYVERMIHVMKYIGFLHHYQKKMERDIQIFKWIIQKKKDVIKSNEAARIFLTTCQYGDTQQYIDLLKLLLEKDVITVDLKNFRNQTGLMLAALMANTNAMKVLLSHIKDDDKRKAFINAKDQSGANALMLAENGFKKLTIREYQERRYIKLHKSIELKEAVDILKGKTVVTSNETSNNQSINLDHESSLEQGTKDEIKTPSKKDGVTVQEDLLESVTSDNENSSGQNTQDEIKTLSQSENVTSDNENNSGHTQDEIKTLSQPENVTSNNDNSLKKKVSEYSIEIVVTVVLVIISLGVGKTLYWIYNKKKR